MAAKQQKLSRHAGLVAITLTASMIANSTFGATSTFVQGATTWNNTASWAAGDITPVPTAGDGHTVGTIPNAVGDTAILQQLVQTGTATIGISLGSQTITLGVLTTRNTTNDYTTALQTGTLVFDNGSNSATFTEGLGSSSNGNSRTRLNVPVTLHSNLTVEQDHNLTRNTATEFVQQVIAASGITLTKTGMGSLQFAYGGASDGFQGNVDIQSGDIRLIDGTTNFSHITSVFNQASGILVENGTQFQLGNTITNFNIAPGAEVKINGLGNTTNTNPNYQYGDGALRFEQTTNSNTICNFNSPVRMQTTSKIYVTFPDVTGVLTQELRGDGTAGLTKGGLGVLKLATTSVNGNPYAGTTVVSNGTLVVNNTVATSSGVGSGNLNVTNTGNGANLAGMGYIGTSADPSNVSLTGAQLYPGDVTTTITTGALITAPGLLTIHGNLTFDSASALNVDLTGTNVGTQYDQISEHGTVTLGGTGLNLKLGSYVPTGAETFDLIDNAGAQPVSGTFGAINGVTGTYNEGATVTLGSATYKLTYAGGANHNDVELIGSAVPTGVPGDFNGNGVVDMADYVLWRDGGPLQNEVSDIGTVTAQDYTDWRARFGNTSGSGSSLGQSTSVPEPTSAILLVMGVVVGLVKSRKR